MSATTSRAPRSAHVRSRQRQRVGVQVGAHDQDPTRLHDVELLARDVGHRGPQPARVLQADVGQHLHARGDDVGGVVAPAEAGLDDGDLHAGARQLVEGGGRERLELRDAVVGPQRAVDHLGGVAGALDGGGEALGRGVLVVDAHALGEGHEVRRQVGARCAGRGGAGSRRSCARSTTCRWCRRRGSSRSAPAASPARSSAGASGPGRSACRRARGSAGSARPRRGSQRLELPSQAVELLALGGDEADRAPWPRSPRWPAWPRRARSRRAGARARPRACAPPRPGRRARPRGSRPCRPRTARPRSARRPPPGPGAPSAPRARRRRRGRPGAPGAPGRASRRPRRATSAAR